jgi:LacI family sucrose operon transcriptional repressor
MTYQNVSGREQHMATLKDVARETGYTVSTVSRILNNRGYISDEARQKVSEAMKKLNYQPNALARSLSKKSTNMIGIIVPHINHPYFSMIISELQTALMHRGYQIMLFNSKNRDDRQAKYVEMCRSNRVAGIILMSGLVSMEYLRKLDVPLITIERNLDCGTASIECDNYGGGRIAAEHLIAHGCRDLVSISGIHNAEMPADARAEGFAKVCAEHGVRCTDIKTTMMQYNTYEYKDVIRTALKNEKGCDGIFASSDIIAAQVIQVAAEYGISIPGDIRLVGFDDSLIASLTFPQITSVHQPVHEMAEMAAQLMTDSIAGSIVPTRTVLPVSLTERESS